MPVSFRLADTRDFAQLADMYAAGIQTIGASKYTAEQITAWSAFATDQPAFTQFIENAYTLVAVDEHDHPLGFCGLDPDGRVASLYVAPQAMRQGIGSALITRICEHARACGHTSVWTQASAFSLPLFLRHGFTIDYPEDVMRNGVSFHRHVLRCVL